MTKTTENPLRGLSHHERLIAVICVKHCGTVTDKHAIKRLDASFVAGCIAKAIKDGSAALDSWLDEAKALKNKLSPPCPRCSGDNDTDGDTVCSTCADEISEEHDGNWCFSTEAGCWIYE